MWNFYEFFAGGGMARMGLGTNWKCTFANDWDKKKINAYMENWGGEELVYADVKTIKAAALPGHPDLIWGSFPCQDLSLAGWGAGLGGGRSGTFWPFWDLLKGLKMEKRNPQLIVLENVVGALTSHQGEDFKSICEGFRLLGYKVGALVINSTHFVPQSRPRLFIIGVREDLQLPDEVQTTGPVTFWHPKSLVNAFKRLSPSDVKNWIWWNLPIPPERKLDFVDLIEEEPTGVDWYSEEQTQKLLSMMSETNLKKVANAQKRKHLTVGGIYRRTRTNGDGEKVQRAEIRLDNTAGCLRTPAGGSSRQIIMAINGEQIKTRLLSPREAARLMGLPETYKLPKNYNEAYHLIGDGLVVPVVRYLAENLLNVIMESAEIKKQIKATANVARSGTGII